MGAAKAQQQAVASDAPSAAPAPVRDNPYAQFIGAAEAEQLTEAASAAPAPVRNNPYAQFVGAPSDEAAASSAAQAPVVRENPYAQFMGSAQETPASSSGAGGEGALGPEMGAQPPPAEVCQAYGDGDGDAEAEVAAPAAPKVRAPPKVVKVDRAIAAFVPHALRRSRQPVPSKTGGGSAGAAARKRGIGVSKPATSEQQLRQPAAKRAKVISASPTTSASADGRPDVFNDFMSEINQLG